jgi:hypothetical protein
MRLGAVTNGWAATAWIDPGGTSGWGIMAVDPHDLLGTKPIEKCIQHWACGEITGNLDQQASEIGQFFELWEDAAIGMENFQLRQIAVELSPVELHAKVKYAYWLMEKWAAEAEDRPMGRPRMIFRQMPSLAKTTLTDDRMRETGLWSPGADHKRDATKHCYTFLQRAQEKPRLRATAWPHLYRTDGTLLKKVPPTSKRSKY